MCPLSVELMNVKDKGPALDIFKKHNNLNKKYEFKIVFVYYIL